jgi:multidrug efflux pump subunit AcrA (membrane-fusion protein)
METSMIARLRAAPALLARRLPAVAIALLIALTPACTLRTQEAAPLPTPVHVHAAALGPAARAIATNGVVEAKDEMRLSFKVGGVVRRIAVQEGEQVKRGERLYVDQVISLEQLQDLRTQAGVTKAQLCAPGASIAAMRPSPRPRTAWCCASSCRSASSSRPARPC